MGIRAKLALVLCTAIAAATGATAYSLVRLEARALADSEEEKTRLLLDTIRQTGQESLVWGDPLVILDQLAFLKRERPELHHCRMLWKGAWHDVGGARPQDPPGGATRHVVDVPAVGERPGFQIEATLSNQVLEDRLGRARAALAANALRSGLEVGALGLLFCALLAAALTRRLVRIEGALAEIGEGKLGASVEVRGSDEIARLARGVTAMSAKLKEVDEMKRTFVASITHELRSPLGAIQSQIRMTLAKDEMIGERAKTALARIGANAERLEHFVTSLLEMAKIERGKLDLTPRAADLGQVAEDVSLFFAPRAKEMGLELTSDIQPGLPPMAFDPELIGQVVTNLVSNAIKFTKTGRVVVRVRPEAGGAACEVEDTGMGITPESLARLFRPFERASNASASSGTGLGLALSKGIVELHGGKLSATSRLGKGSVFRFTLPANLPR